MNKKVVIGIVVVVVVVVAGAAGYFLKLQADAAKWKEAKELVKEESSITKDGVVTKAQLVSIIDAPADRVEDAFWNFEDSPRWIPTVKLAELVEQKGNSKVFKMQIQALKLPIQHYTMEFTRHPGEHLITFKTVASQAQDVEGSYRFEPSPDGKRTRFVSESISRDKIQVPMPQSVIEGAMRETFVETVRGITKKLAQAK
jgi:uncharacterized membrane protein